MCLRIPAALRADSASVADLPVGRQRHGRTLTVHAIDPNPTASLPIRDGNWVQRIALR